MGEIPIYRKSPMIFEFALCDFLAFHGLWSKSNTGVDDEIKNISLSFCCKEDWDSFASMDERSRFCATCKHKVVDFTSSTQTEFQRLTNSGQKICGRFKVSQMSESFLKIAAVSAVMVASTSSIGCTENENVVRQLPAGEVCGRATVGVVMGVPIPPLRFEPGSRFLPIIVGGAPPGEEPLRYNPVIPSKGFYNGK